MRVQSHVEPLADLVAAIRQAKGPEYDVPDFDPLDGGIAAEVLFLLEAVGPKAVSPRPRGGVRNRVRDSGLGVATSWMAVRGC